MRHLVGGGPGRVSAFAATLLLLAAGSCQPPPLDEDAPLETVEVDDGPTAALIPDHDQVEGGSGDSGLAGALPANFPDDLPVFTPSSVTDFGAAGERASYVVLVTDRSPTEVRRALSEALSDSAWTSSDEPFQRTRDNLRAEYRIAPGARGGSEIRIEYGLASGK